VAPAGSDVKFIQSIINKPSMFITWKFSRKGLIRKTLASTSGMNRRSPGQDESMGFKK